MSENSSKTTDPAQPVAPKQKMSDTERAKRLAAHIRPLFVPGQVIELRALECRKGGGRPHTESGYFDTDHLVEMAKAAGDLSPFCKAVYCTFNGLRPELIHRRANRTDWANEGELTKDKHVLTRLWLLIDLDPVRDSLISASQAEKEHARQLAEEVERFLREMGWPEPILADSGNGYHLYYRIDLPAVDGGLVARILKKLARQFDRPEAKVDQTVFNAAQITKFPGTLARKGDNTKDRPHRRAELLRLPGEPTSALDILIVSRELLERVGGKESSAVTTNPTHDPQKNPSPASRASSRLKIPDWLTEQGVGFRIKDGVDGLGRTTYVLTCCPFDSSHADPDACVMQDAEGKLSAKCFHNTCAGRGWQEFKKALGEPKAHHYDPPRSKKKKSKPTTAQGKPSPANGGEEPPTFPESSHLETPQRLPQIQGNKRQLPEVTDDALQALLLANNPPLLFQRGGVLTRIRPGCDEDPPMLEPLTDPALRGCMARVAQWTRLRDTQEGEIIEEASPPLEVVKDLAHLPRWQGIPPLRQLIETPVFDARGQLVATPGYHPESRLWYEPTADLPIPDLESLLESGSVSWAREFLVEELLGDFPFTDDASRAHAIAAILLPFVRPMIDGPTPLHLFDAPVEGTGKTLLATLVSLITTGREIEPMAEATCDDEWRKRITAVLAEGPSIILLDNLNRLLDAGSLASVLTSRRWKDRILGVSKTARLPNTALWLASGNNTRLSRELIRRTVFCRMDAKVDVPWERQSFRHPHLMGWTKKNRGALVQAALTLCSSWIVAGRKPGSGRMGMFESWVETIGGILEHAGIPGFLANAATFRSQRADQVSEWRAFVKSWWDRHQDAAVGVVELFSLVTQEKLLDREIGDKGERSQRIKLGQVLARYADRVCGDYRIVLAGSDHKERQRYRLERIGEPTPDPPESENAWSHSR